MTETTGRPRHEAARALIDLQEALRAHGIVLPSLELDPASLWAAENGTDRRPLLSLGRVNLPTARKLAAVLKEAAR